MDQKQKKDYFDFRAFFITYSPFLLGAFALFVELPAEYSKFRLFLIWSSLELSSLIALIRKEIPRLYPYVSVKGRQAQIVSGLAFIFWSVLGLLWLLAEIFELQ